MKCPFCGYAESKVIDSRPTDENERIRRRRECMQCGKRFTTYEIIEDVPISVVKKDKSREVDEVAYVRFASVYKEFDSASAFVDEISKLQ